MLYCKYVKPDGQARVSVTNGNRLPLSIYVVWHPANRDGDKVARRIHQCFDGDRFRNVAGGSGLSVLYRNATLPGDEVPMAIDWESTEATAVIALMDSKLARDPAWTEYVQELARDARTRGLLALFVPVIMDSDASAVDLEEQAMRWDRWERSQRDQLLLIHILNEMVRVLKYVSRSDHTSQSADTFSEYLQKLQVFISHSKHDNTGVPTAHSIRDWIHQYSGMASFFDVQDIPAGLSFRRVLLHQIRNSVVLAIHTDSYSSREWCRREVIEAKLNHVPMVVIDCLQAVDQRSMPYLGNVPIVRMMYDQQTRIGAIVRCLLEEVLRTYLWRCRVRFFESRLPDVLFTARPPELTDLATLPSLVREGRSTIVYPDPLLSADDVRLFSIIAPNVRTRTLTDWLKEQYE